VNRIHIAEKADLIRVFLPLDCIQLFRKIFAPQAGSAFPQTVSANLPMTLMHPMN